MQKEDVRISHQTENQKENVGIDYVPGTYIGLSPFALALEGGLNSNPSRRERLFLRTANLKQDQKTVTYMDGTKRAAANRRPRPER